MAPTTGTGERYALAMGELWSGVARTLTRLDRIAGEPDSLAADESIDELSRLQYSLHVGSEHVYGLQPPAGAETAHAELAAALAGARDATAEVAEAIEDWGPAGVDPLLHEWRGALFRVRLARLRLAAPAPRAVAAPEQAREEIAWPLTAFLLALGGALALVAGAALGLWPLWTAGMLAVCGAVLAYRP